MPIMRKRKNKNNNLLLSWLKSYILILLLPVVIINISYFVTVKVIEEQISSAHTASLRQLQRVMDDRLKDIQKLSIEIALNENNKLLLNVKDELMPNHRYAMTKLINELHVYKVANGFINDIFIYYRIDDIIISGNGKSVADEYYDLYYKDSSLKYDEWLNMLRGLHKKDYIPLDMKLVGDKTAESIAFVQTLPLYESKTAPANIVVITDDKTIQHAIEETRWLSEGTVLIMDQFNNLVVVSNNFCLPEYINYSTLNRDQDIMMKNIDGNEVVISYVSSDINGWKYISVFPRSVFLQKAKYSRNIVALSVAVCLFIGIAAAYFLSKRNYNPVEKIVRMFEKKASKTDEGKYAGYDFIEKSIKEMFDRQDRMAELLSQQNPVLADNFLYRMLKGRVKDRFSIQQACETYGITLDNDYFCVMLFYINSYGDIWDKEDTASPEDVMKTIHFVITNVVKELTHQNNNAYMAEVDEMLVCVINLKEADEYAQQEMHNIAVKSRDFIMKEFAVNITVAISNICKGTERISEAYQEAMEAMEYKMIMGSEGIVSFSDVAITSYNNCRYSMDEERQFINCIKSNDYKKARETLDRIFDEFLLNNRHSSIQLVKCRMFGLVNTMINVLEDNCFSGECDFVQEMNLVEKLLNCRTVKDLQDEMNTILINIDNSSNNSGRERDMELKDNVMKIVARSYCNAGFGVAAIADSLKINEAQLSRNFKKQAGIGLLDYIHKVRIANAKELMESRNYSIKEIAGMTGYSDSISFIRVFKKYEGITPGKFKESHEK